MRDKLERSLRPTRSSRRSFPTRPSPPTSRSSRVSTRSTHTSPTSSLPRASTSARSMTSRLPRKCCTIPPMPMRRRCSRWTSPKTRPSSPARGRHQVHAHSERPQRRQEHHRRDPLRRRWRRGGHLRRRPVQDVSALLRVARLEDYRARFQPQRGRRL